jgi:hypothetical protein
MFKFYDRSSLSAAPGSRAPSTVILKIGRLLPLLAPNPDHNQALKEQAGGGMARGIEMIMVLGGTLHLVFPSQFKKKP